MKVLRFRRLCLGAGLCLFASVACAHGTHAAAPAAKPEAPAARVAIDPETGKVRPVEHDDAPATEETMRALSRSSQIQSTTREIMSRSGARGMMLDESFMSFTVVRRNADGSLSSACVQGQPAALRLLQTAAPMPRDVKAGGAYETE